MLIAAIRPRTKDELSPNLRVSGATFSSSPRGLDRLAPLQKLVGPMSVNQQFRDRQLQEGVRMLGIELG
jgi:hypothetical protein